MEKNISWGVANADNPEQIIRATQESLIDGMIGFINGLKKDLNQPGLTWEQIEYVLKKWRDKKPQVFQHSEEAH